MLTKDNTLHMSEITTALIQESNMSEDIMNVCVDKSRKVSDASESEKKIIDTVMASISSVSENMISVLAAIKKQSIASTEISKLTNAPADTSIFTIR